MKQFYWREELENFHDRQLIGDTSVTLVEGCVAYKSAGCLLSTW